MLKRVLGVCTCGMQVRVVTWLMDRGVDPISSSGGVGAFVTACSQGKVEIVHTILERMQGRHKQAELCR